MPSSARPPAQKLCREAGSSHCRVLLSTAIHWTSGITHDIHSHPFPPCIAPAVFLRRLGLTCFGLGYLTCHQSLGCGSLDDPSTPAKVLLLERECSQSAGSGSRRSSFRQKQRVVNANVPREYKTLREAVQPCTRILANSSRLPHQNELQSMPCFKDVRYFILFRRRESKVRVLNEPILFDQGQVLRAILRAALPAIPPLHMITQWP